MKTNMIFSPSPWTLPVKARAICADGKIRTFKLGQPDTYFSIPAWGKILGKAVRGFVSCREDGELEYRVWPNRNFSCLPEIFQRSHLEAKIKCKGWGYENAG